MEQKKYRVKTANGDIRVIEASNIHDAQTKARIQFGALPNDINSDITKKAVTMINNCLDELKESSDRIKNETKNLDWADANSSIYDLAKYLEQTASDLKSIAGSMIKESK